MMRRMKRIILLATLVTVGSLSLGVAAFPSQAAAMSGNPDLIKAYVEPFMRDTDAKMIIWGLDLNRISFSAFKHRNMFNPRYYLRRQRFLAYQLAMIFTVVGECIQVKADATIVRIEAFMREISLKHLRILNLSDIRQPSSAGYDTCGLAPARLPGGTRFDDVIL